MELPRFIPVNYSYWCYVIAYFGCPALVILLIVAYVCVRDWHHKRRF